MDELTRLPNRERFTSAVEEGVLNEAEVHSNQYAADSIQTNIQPITKTAMINKVYAIEKELLEMEEQPIEKKACKYLQVEADDDHIISYPSSERQKRAGRFFGKLVYLFEGKVVFSHSSIMA